MGGSGGGGGFSRGSSDMNFTQDSMVSEPGSQRTRSRVNTNFSDHFLCFFCVFPGNLLTMFSRCHITPVLANLTCMVYQICFEMEFQFWKRISSLLLRFKCP